MQTRVINETVRPVTVSQIEEHDCPACRGCGPACTECNPCTDCGWCDGVQGVQVAAALPVEENAAGQRGALLKAAELLDMFGDCCKGGLFREGVGWESPEDEETYKATIATIGQLRSLAGTA